MIANGLPSAAPPFDRMAGRVEWAEPDLGRELFGCGRAVAADRDGFAQIIFGYQHHQACFGRARRVVLPSSSLGLPIMRQSLGAVEV